jgi:two-component system chemotaxis response regulator CheB
MDLVMPGMDGMEATRRIMARHPTPVLFLSSYFDKEGNYTRADALAAGALDVIEKPALMPDWRWQTTAGALIQKVKALAQVPVISHIHPAAALSSERLPERPDISSNPAVVAIGASSGGPRILEEILSQLPATFALGVVIVQHMSDGFMPGLLNWMQQRCALQVRAAEEGDAIVPRRVLFAPERKHLIVQHGGRVHLSEGEPVSGHRPSVDVMFTSVAKMYAARAAGFLLTGMGADGAAGLMAVRRAGGRTFAQTEETCSVFGMPRAAIELGAVQEVLSPADMARRLNGFHVERVRSLP